MPMTAPCDGNGGSVGKSVVVSLIGSDGFGSVRRDLVVCGKSSVVPKGAVFVDFNPVGIDSVGGGPVGGMYLRSVACTILEELEVRGGLASSHAWMAKEYDT